ncbi:MAG: DUF6788 family protein [Thermoanaerobaculia bacterium]
MASFGEPRAMRRGSVCMRMVKCSKRGCPCAENQDARHGHYYSLTYAMDGKTVSRLLSAEQAEIARGQIEAGRQFLEAVEWYLALCRGRADSELEISSASACATEAE